MGSSLATIKHLIFPSERKPIKVFLRGLSESGKTTIMYKLATGVPRQANPNIPIEFRVEQVKINEKVTIEIWDVNSSKLKGLWELYYDGCRAVVWVVDSTNVERMEQLRAEFDKFIFHEKLRHSIVMVLANKQDLKSSHKLMQDQFIVEKLGLNRLTEQKRPWSVFSCSARQMEGFDRALDWLGKQLASK